MRRAFEQGRRLLVIFASLLWSSGHSAIADALYSATDLGAGTADYGIAGFNNNGEIAGNTPSTSTQQGHAFVYENGHFDNIGTNLRALGINASGQVVGTTNGPQPGEEQAFVRNPNGDIREIAPVTGTATLAINDSGQVAKGDASGVTVYNGSTSTSVQFTWPNLGPPPIAPSGPTQPNYLSVRGISDSGTVVGTAYPNAYAGIYPAPPGSQPYSTDSKNVANVLFPMGSQSGEAIATSPKGWILGTQSAPSGIGYFVAAPGQDSPQALSFKGLFTGLQGLLYLTGINDHGVVVGAANLQDGFAQGAVAIDGNKLLDLNALIPVSSNFHLDSALLINDAGQILAKGHYLDSNDPSEHLFILSADAVQTPEPSTLATFSLSFIAMVLYIKRRK